MIRKVTYILFIIFALFLLVGCSEKPDDEMPSNIPVYQEELNAELSDPRLLKRLGVDEIILLEVETYHVTIGSPDISEPLGELYYTIQDGWHLKAENEVMKFVPGEGWLIAEQ